jgi:hypothetical protein
VTDQRRKQIALVLFVVDALGCGIWAYLWAVKPIRIFMGSDPDPGAASGVSGGILDLAFTVVPPIVTIVLARASGSTLLARHWRNAHLAATLALIIVPMMASFRVLIVSIAIFIPVQVFFVVGAVAIWIGSPRRQADTSREATS